MAEYIQHIIAIFNPALYKMVIFICSLISVLQLRYNYFTVQRINSKWTFHQTDMDLNRSLIIRNLGKGYNKTSEDFKLFKILPKCEQEIRCKTSEYCGLVQ